LTEAAGSDVTISFTPHLMPMTRGMQSTCYVKMAQGVDVQQLRQRLEVPKCMHDCLSFLEQEYLPSKPWLFLWYLL